MKLTLKPQRCYVVEVDGKEVGTFFVAGREWNGMFELAEFGQWVGGKSTDAGAKLIVEAPGHMADLFSGVFGNGTEVDLIKAAPSLIDRIRKLQQPAAPREGAEA